MSEVSDRPRTKQTARKSTHSRVSHYNLAEYEYHEEEDDDDSDYEDDDASMESDSERLQTLRHQLDETRQKLSAELDKGAARDKELVSSYERSIQYLGMKVQSLVQAEPGQDIMIAGQSIVTAITISCQSIVRAIDRQGENIQRFIETESILS